MLIVDAYREMAMRGRTVMPGSGRAAENVARSLKPQGRLGIVDFNPGEGGPGPAPDERVDPEAVIAPPPRPACA